MLNLRNRNNRNQRNRRSRPSPLQSQQTALLNAIKDLTVVTQDYSLPDHPDRRPMEISRRPKVMTFSRSVGKGTIIASQFEEVKAYSFALSDLPSYTDFTSLFDQYRIAEIILEFIPVSVPFGESTSSTAYPSIHSVIDLDDDTLPASVDTLRQYATHQVVPNQKYFRRVLTPRFAVAAYSGAFTSYSQSQPFQWIDSASAGVLHYGVKTGTTPVTTASGQFVLYNVDATYIIQCRNSI